jgi:hypothetical protein
LQSRTGKALVKALLIVGEKKSEASLGISPIAAALQLSRVPGEPTPDRYGRQTVTKQKARKL